MSDTKYNISVLMEIVYNLSGPVLYLLNHIISIDMVKKVIFTVRAMNVPARDGKIMVQN